MRRVQPIKESGEKLDPADRLAIESATNDLKKALEHNDSKGISRTLEALMQAQQKAAANLYKNAGASSGSEPGSGPDAGAPPHGDGHADDVIDAEVVEEKKN